MQLAWEMLELAKNILVKQSENLEKAEAKEADKERKDKVNSRICDTFQTLGELSIENENYPQAIEDLGTCLQRRKEMLPEDSRLIAETHYQLGVAQGKYFFITLITDGHRGEKGDPPMAGASNLHPLATLFPFI